MDKKWNILILTPYIIMLAILIFYSLVFGGIGVLGLVIVMQIIALEIPFILLYTIILGISLMIRWIILRRGKR